MTSDKRHYVNKERRMCNNPSESIMTGPLRELHVLRKALDLLLDIAYIDDTEAIALLAQQTRNVLRHGTRQPEGHDASTLPDTHPASPTPALEPTLTALRALLTDVDQPTAADARRTLNLDDEIPGYTRVAMPDYSLYFPEGAPELDGCTVPERVYQLGYRLTCDEYEVHIPRLRALAREAWGRQFGGEPTWKDQADWYDTSDHTWLDPLIRSYLAQCPDIAQEPTP